MAKSFKERVYEILEATDPEDRVAETANLIMLLLVVSNVAAVVLETVESINLVYKDLFHYFADISIVIFTIEYLLRVWSCDVEPKYRQPILGRLRFALTPLALIDLMVILPTYVVLAFPSDHQLLRSLRLLWTFRLLKLRRYSESLETIENVIQAQQRELFMSFSAILFFMVLSSTVVYFLIGFPIAYGISFLKPAEELLGKTQGYDLVHYFFLLCFAACIPAIISGGIAERGAVSSIFCGSALIRFSRAYRPPTPISSYARPASRI